jgi:superfamily II DNA or RNA helicase
MVRWVRRLQESVDKSTQAWGTRFFHAGKVSIQSGRADRVEALVRDTTLCSVVIQLEGDNDVVATCTATHASSNICSHTWAVLLAAERQLYLQRVGSRWNPVLVNRPPTERLDDSQGSQLTSLTPTRRGGSSKAWKSHLAALRRSLPETPEPGDPKRRIVYAIDIHECALESSLIVKIAESTPKKSGEWKKVNFRYSSIKDIASLDLIDQRMIGLLSGSGGYLYSFGENASARHRISPSAVEVLVPMLCATERLHIGDTRHAEDLVQLKWDSSPPWEFQLVVREDDAQKNYILEGVLRRSGEDVSLASPLLLVPGIVFFAGTAARFDDKRAFTWVAFLKKTGSLVIPIKQREELLSEIAQFFDLPPIELPIDLRVETRTFEGPPELRLRAINDPWRTQKHLECEIRFDYGVKVDPLTSGAAQDPRTGHYFKRDRVAEDQALERLRALGVQRRLGWRASQGWEVAASKMPALVRALMAEGWRVEAEGKLYRHPSNLKFGVTSGIDWFELHGEADFEGHSIELPELLRALTRGEHMVRLGDGSFGILPEEWLHRYGLIARMGKPIEGALRFVRSQAGLLELLLASEPEASFDEGFRRIRQELGSFAGVEAVSAPANFQGSLRDYQKEGLGWLQFLRRFGFGGCLADDMGLGKTVQVLALAASVEKANPMLVVVPRSLVFNWIQESARFAPHLKVLEWSGTSRRAQWEKISQHDLIVTTYGTLRRDIERFRNLQFDTVILDEAQAIKNASTDSAKAVRLLRANNRLALSGTPIENRMSDLWSLFEFLNPGLLGSAAVFQEQTALQPDGDSVRLLSMALRPFFLRRTKDKVAKELPAKTEQTIHCELDSEQRRLYDELREHYRASLLHRVDAEGLSKSRMHVLEALLRLRQAACHPGLIDKSRIKESSAKLDLLLARLREVVEEGHKALVFSQFTSLLDILRPQLEAADITYEYLDGKTRDRDERVRRFQEDDKCPLFLISLKAGGLGLNLTAAEYVFLLDPWWNPAVEAQAIDRTHRIGQSQHVFAYRLIARGTVEEKVLELQQSKRDLADAIITADNSVMKDLTREHLELLLS